MDFNQLIANAQTALDAIAASPEFIEILDKGRWDSPSTTLTDCCDCLQDLQQASNELKDTQDLRNWHKAITKYSTQVLVRGLTQLH